MSHRENVAQQLALMTFVGLAVALSVATYVYFRRSEEEFKKAQALTVRVAELEAARQTADEERDRLKLVIGHATAVSVAAVHDAHRTDALEVDPTTAGKTPYRGLLTILGEALRGAVSRESDARGRAAAALIEIDRQKGDFTSRLAVEERRSAEFQRQLAEAENIFARERIRITAFWDQLAEQLKDKLRLLAEWERRFFDMERNLSNQLAAANRKYETLRDRWEKDRIDDLERPDGKVTDVNARVQVVTINLGRADLLPKGQQFSVYDAAAARIQTAKRKGTIEVTRLLDEHLAEARITSDSLRDPILPGDQVHTPGWQPGRARHFALAAPLDYDGDGKSDYQFVRNLILASGGVIDAEVDEQGVRKGELSVETRYVIVGSPASKLDAAKGEAVGKLLSEAKQLGVDPLSATKFFDLVGYVPPARVVKYGGLRPSR